MSPTTRVSFFTNKVFLPLKERKRLKKFILSFFAKEKKQLNSLGFIFCTDEFLLDINQRFLSHDFYTDIITFNLSMSKNPIVAEAYISIDRVRENAKLENSTFQKELHRVIFHGALHLCGYNDKGKLAKTKMRKMENKLLGLYANK